MRMIALAKEDSIAYWRKELPNATAADEGTQLFTVQTDDGGFALLHGAEGHVQIGRASCRERV